MDISPQLSDDAVLAELGARIGRRRVNAGLTQAALARQAGVSKRTVERIEAGASAQMSSVIRILRLLDLLAGLDQAIPAGGPRPMDLLRLGGKARRRASGERGRPEADKPWSWDDDA